MQFHKQCKKTTIMLFLIFFILSGCQDHNLVPRLETLGIEAVNQIQIHETSVVWLELTLVNNGTGPCQYIELDPYLVFQDSSRLALYENPKTVPGSVGIGQTVVLPLRVLIPSSALDAQSLDVSIGYYQSSISATLDIDVLAGLLESESNDSYLQADPVLKDTGVMGQIDSTDEDWYSLSLANGEKIGVTADGESSDVQVSLYRNDDITLIDSFTGDDFTTGRQYRNDTGSDITLYIKVTGSVSQNYWLIAEGLE